MTRSVSFLFHVLGNLLTMGPWAFLSEEPPIFASLGAITYELAALWAHACSPYFSHVIMNNHERGITISRIVIGGLVLRFNLPCSVLFLSLYDPYF